MRCPFHGWRFAPDGTNQHVPWNPDAKREHLGAKALPTAEVGGLAWVHTSFARPGSVAPPEPSAELLREDVRMTTNEVVVAAHWTRVIENAIDDAHLPFVHGRSIGKGMLGSPADRMDVEVEDHPCGFSWRALVNGEAQTYRAELRLPNVSFAARAGAPRVFITQLNE